MKNFTFISLIFFGLIYFSSCKCDEECCKSTKVDTSIKVDTVAKNMLGEVFIRASKSNHRGLIKMETIHTDQSTQDIPVILYDTSGHYNLQRGFLVEFDIIQIDSFFWADNISYLDSSSYAMKLQSLNKTDVSSVQKTVKMNFHNTERDGDEQTAHNKIHVHANYDAQGELILNGEFITAYNYETNNRPENRTNILLYALPPYFENDLKYYHYYHADYGGLTVYTIDDDHDH